MEKTITIPDYFLHEDDFTVQLFDYSSSENSEKQCINLTKHTFSFLIEGQKEVIGSNDSVLVKNTHFLLMKSGRCLMTEKLSSANKNYKSILLFFSNEFIYQFIRNHKLKIDSRQSKKSIYSFQYDDFIHNFVKSIIDVSKLSKKVQKKLVLVKLEEILIYLVEKNNSDFLYAMLEENNQHIQKHISIVESNKLNKLTVEELAFLCNMSVSSFKRFFVKHYNQSPIKWFQDQRLQHAAMLLKSKKKRPSDIYLDIGYENLSSFIQAFKSKYGLTPRQYK